MHTIFAATVLSFTNVTTGDVFSGVASTDLGDIDTWGCFFQGFGMIMAAGLIAAGVRWVRKSIGGSSVEEL